MKYYQMKSLIITLLVFFLAWIVRWHLEKKNLQNWNAKIQHLICYELSEAPAIPEENEIHVQIVGKENTMPYKKRIPVAKKSNARIKFKKKMRVTQINTAGLDDWKSLPGIGDILSERIIKFRNKLGGFHSVYQLQEVYGVSSETFERIHSVLRCNGSIEQMDLANVEFKSLLSHPYFSYEDVKAIFNYQKKKVITSSEQLQQVVDKDASWIKKVWPYIKTENVTHKDALVKSQSK